MPYRRHIIASVAATPKEPWHAWKKYASGLLVLAAIASLWPGHSQAQNTSATSSTPATPAASAAPAAISTALATRKMVAEQLPGTLPAEGVVEATQQATLAAQVSGRVMDLRVDAGSRIKAGQLLLQLDAREATAAQAAANAQLQQARAAVERSRQLRTQGFISQAALDLAEASFSAASAAASQASSSSSHSQIRAPFDGIVKRRLVELGDMAQPGRPLLEIYQPDGLRVLTSLPQAQLASLSSQEGVRARIELPGQASWPDAERIEPLPTLNAQSHSANLRVYLPTSMARGLTPGLFARVHFLQPQASGAQVLTLPNAAILRRNELNAVYVIDSSGRPRLRQVRLGTLQANGEIEIRAGVSAGENVALDALAASTRPQH